MHRRGSERLPARAILLLHAVLLVGLAGAAEVAPPTAEVAPPTAEVAPPCEDSASGAVAVFSSPRAPQLAGVLRAIAVSERRLTATLVILDPDGQPAGATTERRGGPPYWWYVDVTPSEAGAYRAILRRGTKEVACRTIEVGPAKGDERGAGKGVWPVTQDWSRATENLYSAWIEKLFDDPLDAEPAWRALHEVTRDPERNFLHDHLDLGEDGEHGLRLEPDCADLPYFLRAYFAWKLGLPFGYSECTRGDGGKPPHCGRWHSNLEASEAHGPPLERMQAFIEGEVGPAAQSGAGRTPGDDDRTDFYPTSLAQETLRPGTVYADPYGHVLVVVRRLPQTATSGGLLLAVDAQPDGTVARKRYWRGNFLFTHDPSLGSAGFKHVRPVVRADDGLRPLDNVEIQKAPAYGDFDLEQDELKTEEFYDRVDAVLSPRPQDPSRAVRATLDALDEQVHARVRSVANGEDYLAKHPGVVPMPEGAAVFETAGPWEDFATPARDLRLLIAIDAARAFPEKVVGQPERFVLPAGQAPDAVHAELEALLERGLTSHHVDYTRSDGSTWTLSLAEVVERAPALEMAYNPNDCIEVRWGAPPQSTEAGTCRRHAPAEQAERMRRYREWFSQRRRPPR
jgi:hypothetical protein